MKILIAERSRATSTALARLLQNTGYTVEIAYDGVQALEYLQKDRFDLMRAAIDLPRIDGRTLIRRAADSGVAIPTIGVLSVSEVTKDDLIQNVGFEALLPKPYPVEELLSLVQSLEQEDKEDHGGLTLQQRRLLATLSTDRAVSYRELASILPELYGTISAFIAATNEILARSGSKNRIVTLENGYKVRTV